MSKLRAVGPDEKAPKRAPRTLTEAVEQGSDRDVLASLRLALARSLESGDVSSNSMASVSKEIRELDRLIRQLDAEQASGEERDRDSRQRRTFNPEAV